MSSWYEIINEEKEKGNIKKAFEYVCHEGLSLQPSNKDDYNYKFKICSDNFHFWYDDENLVSKMNKPNTNWQVLKDEDEWPNKVRQQAEKFLDKRMKIIKNAPEGKTGLC